MESDQLQEARLEFRRKWSIIRQLETGLSRAEHEELLREYLAPVERKIRELELTSVATRRNLPPGLFCLIEK